MERETQRFFKKFLLKGFLVREQSFAISSVRDIAGRCFALLGSAGTSCFEGVVSIVIIEDLLGSCNFIVLFWDNLSSVFLERAHSLEWLDPNMNRRLKIWGLTRPKSR